MEQLSELTAMRTFAESFFKNLGATIALEGTALKITNIPSPVEKIFNKKGPYTLVFAKEDESPGTDLITKGSIFLKTMIEYLDKKGNTALIKLQPAEEPLDLFSKVVKIQNASITHSTKKATYESFVRFTFLTTYQYKNEKEQFTSTVYVREDQIMDPKLDSFQLTQGRSQDIPSKSIDKEYMIAKEYVRKTQEEKKNTIVQQLQEQLQKEIERVKAHYATHIAEFDAEQAKLQKQMQDTQKELSLGKINKGEADSKIKRAQQALAKATASNRKEQLTKEESFFITDEINKHQLAVTNKLVNTALMYYPLYSYELFVKSKDAGRLLYWNFDSLTQVGSSVQCDDCKAEATEIALCAAGHITCMKCGEYCDSCRGVMCAACAKRKCSQCHKSSCKNCLSRCTYCSTPLCKSHLIEESKTHRLGCRTCLKNCSKCNSIVPAKTITAQGCTDCQRKEKLHNILSSRS